MHFLICPNAFKNSLSADKAALAIASGLQQSGLPCTFECFPIGDGGDGTAELIIERMHGKWMSATVHDPLGRKITASFGIIENGRTAVIEMASASGLRLLQEQELNPLVASTRGTGELIKHALDFGAAKIIVAMGGSATVDGGTGILSALGIKFLDASGKVIPMPSSFDDLSSIDISGVDPRIKTTEIIILCDVDNRLLGANGAAGMFGPQKGATKKDLITLESRLKKFAELTLQITNIDINSLKYGGTAGGAAAGVHAFLNARLEKGINYFLELTNFQAHLEKADIVITGEGSIDEQTLQGKGPAGVAIAAKEKNKMVIALAGRIPTSISKEFNKYFDLLLPISNNLPLATAIEQTRENLKRTAAKIAEIIAARGKPEL